MNWFIITTAILGVWCAFVHWRLYQTIERLMKFENFTCTGLAVAMTSEAQVQEFKTRMRRLRA